MKEAQNEEELRIKRHRALGASLVFIVLLLVSQRTPCSHQENDGKEYPKNKETLTITINLKT